MRGLIPLLLALCSCAPFHFERQRIFLRHDAEADTLDLLLVFENVGRVDGDHDEAARARKEAEALAAIRQIAAGGQRFLLIDWPWDLDLDALVRDPGAAQGRQPPVDELARRLIARAGDVKVTGAELVGDPQGHVALLQRVHVRNASGILALANDVVSVGIREGELEDTSGQPARLAWADAGKTWLAFAPDGTLELACPVSPEEAAAFARAGLDPEFAGYAQLLAGLTRLELQDGVLRLAFAPRADGWIVFDVRFPDRKLTPEVAQALVADDDVQPGPVDGEVTRLLALD